jgi:hypothetical protein
VTAEVFAWVVLICGWVLLMILVLGLVNLARWWWTR